MDLPHPDQFFAATRKDGWSPETKARFLVMLADSGNVRLSARRCELSAQSAYVQRRSDPWFARGWAAALVHARAQAEQVLADRAIEGIEEEIWYRGELVGTRRRYDNRLLLAHLARLDRQTADEDAAADAERFDAIVATVAGVDIPEALDCGGDGLPREREVCAHDAGEKAREDAIDTLPVDDDAPFEERVAAIEAIAEKARVDVRNAWNGWSEAVEAAVDRASAYLPQDRINPSTSQAPRGAAGPVTSA